MVAIKKSVRLVDNACKVCAVISRSSLEDGGAGVNWSGSINTMADEYLIMIQENKPELSPNKWNALYCAYNGYLPSEDPQKEARLLSWHISEGYQYNEQIRDFLGSKEEAIDFIEEIKTWPLTKQLSAIYHAKEYWINI